MKFRKVTKYFIRFFDIYAQPITLTYKGKQSFATSIGGILSFFIILFLQAVFWYKFSLLVGFPRAPQMGDMIRKTVPYFNSPDGNAAPVEDLSGSGFSFLV